jgi:hypothetical protein
MVRGRLWVVVGLGGALALSAGVAWSASNASDSGSIQGVVVGPDEEGLGGVTVTAFWLAVDGESPWEGVSEAGESGTGVDGGFVVGGLEPGSYVLRVGGDGWGTVFAPGSVSMYDAARFDVGVDGEVDAGVVSLNPAGVISGSVVSDDGGSVAGALVRAVPVLDDGLDPSLGVNGVGTVGESGGFLLEGLPAGSYEVVVAGDADYLAAWSSPSGEAGGAVVVQWGTTSLVAEPIVRVRAGGLSGVVRAADGSGVGGLAVTLRKLGGDGSLENFAFGETSGDGAYSFLGLPAGEYVPGVEREGGLVVLDGPVEPVTVVPGEVVAAAPSEVGQGGAVSGVVVDGGGGPVGGVKVVAFEASGDLDDPWVGTESGVTGADGRYTIRGLGAGSVLVWVEGNEDLLAAYSNAVRFEEDAAEVPVDLGSTSQVGVTALSPAGKIVGTVSGPAVNASGARAVVLAYQDYGGELIIVGGGDVGDGGGFTVGGLFSGSYLVRVFDGSGRVPQGVDEGLIDVVVDASGEPVQVTGLSVEE